MSSPSSHGGSPAQPMQQQFDGPPPPQEPQEPLSEFDTSFFPAPSPFYLRYTSHNLALPLDEDPLISDVPGEPVPFHRSDLEPPNVDWIVEEGSYSVFGETWPIDEKVPTLEEMGVKEMFERGVDRKLSLQTLLRTLLLTYTQLLDALLTPPPSLAHPRPPGPTDPERLTEHLRLIAINMHYLVNELRPVQARETLKNMMRAQIELRKAKTAAIRQKCDAIKATLSTLHSDVLSASASSAASAADKSTGSSKALRADLASSAADDALEVFRRLQAKVDALGV
ncbi:hypothetical protein JCM8097_002817 [Rhodosporidiobolus ruineniae]